MGALLLLLGCASVFAAPRLMLDKTGVDELQDVPQWSGGDAKFNIGSLQRTRFGPGNDVYTAIVWRPASLWRRELTADEWFNVVVGGADLPDGNAMKTHAFCIRIYEQGWPWRCFDKVELLASSRRWTSLRGDTSFEGVWIGHIRWLPFAANVALHTAGWTALLLGARRARSLVRERSRRRAGCCVSCGYNREGLTADAVCPECGKGAVAP